MKAVVFRGFGGPDVLRIEDVPTPEPGPGEVLVRVAAVSVNNLDLRLRSGDYHRLPALPHVLGWDPAGTVAAVGDQVTVLAEGDRVVFKGRLACRTCPSCSAGHPARCERPGQLGLDRWGGYAEYVALPAENVHSYPDNLSPIEASVIYRHFPQAFNLLDEVAALQEGEWVLVVGAAGALGSCLVQVAKLRGARIVAGAGSDERAAACLQFGADVAVNYRTSDLAARVKEITGGHGVDVVTENVGDPTLWPGAFASLARGGRLVTVGAHGGGTVPLDVNQLYMMQQRVLGTAGSRPSDLDTTIELAAEGRLRAVVGGVLPLEEASRAHRMAHERSFIGKLMLVPDASAGVEVLM